MSDNDNDNAIDGFIFGMTLLDSLDAQYDRSQITRCLREVANGERSLLNSPEEELGKMERERGYPSTPDEKSLLLSHMRNSRAKMDAENMATAKCIIAKMPPEGMI